MGRFVQIASDLGRVQAMLALLALLSPFLAPVLAGGAQAGEAGSDARRPVLLVIGLDLSKSNPLVVSDSYAGKVADRVAPMVAALRLRDRVMVRSFGSYDATSNTLRIDETISARARPEDMARGIRTLIAGVPKLVREGKLVAQDRTNILPFLHTMAQVVDCTRHHVRYVLLTDGVEDSEYARLAAAGGALPPPEHPVFAGCGELQILGLGQGLNSPRATQRLRGAWAAWAQAAGFDRFTGLYDW